MHSMSFGFHGLLPSLNCRNCIPRCVSKFLFSRFYTSFSTAPRSLNDLVGSNPHLHKALDLFNSNKIEESLEIALAAYKAEFIASDSESVLTSSVGQDRLNRPCFWFISELLCSLGPHHPETAGTIARMGCLSELAEPFKPRIIQKRHGGYPVRLNNGKWTWQGPHWSRRNNRTWKTGYSSDFTFGLDLLAGDLPSEDEEEDSDYVTENEGSSFDDEEEAHPSYKKDIIRVRAAKHFTKLMEIEDAKITSETHPDVLVDPLWLEFQKTVDPEDHQSSSFLAAELAKYSNITKSEQLVDVAKYKRMARGESSSSMDCAEVARAGLRDAHAEVSESVRFAGQTVVLTKRAGPKRIRPIASEGSIQSYLNQIRSKRTVSSVEKSKADWNVVKQTTEGLEEALKADKGFIDRKAFLLRTDERQDDLRREFRRRET